MKLCEILRFKFRYDKNKDGIPRIDNPKLADMFTFGKLKVRKKFEKKKKPKEITAKGAYCPKEKPGMSWSHIKDTRKEDDTDREDVA